MWDADKATVRVARMWKALGTALDAASRSAAERGRSDDALKMAQAADACYWQATGDGEMITLKDLCGEAN